MTECDRILKSGLVSKDFFSPETICDYYVSEYQKKVWAVGLDLLIKFDEICKKHHLRYALFFGTLLGAVRHKGFIPWDDDIDVAMPRGDYEKLQQMGGAEFMHPYFLQTIYSNDGSCFSHAKLRNSNTTAIVPIFQYESFNMGMFLDIFPFDTCSTDNLPERYLEVDSLCRILGTLMRKNHPHLSENDKERVRNLPNMTPMEIYDKIQSLARQDEGKENANHMGYISGVVYKWERQIFDKNYFDVIEGDFMGYKVPIPRYFDDYLSIIYGDYMKLPPVENRESRHAIFLDMDTSYTEYLMSL